MAIFVFSTDYSEALFTVWAKHLGAMGKSDFFKKMGWLIGFGVTVS